MAAPMVRRLVAKCIKAGVSPLRQDIKHTTVQRQLKTSARSVSRELRELTSPSVSYYPSGKRPHVASHRCCGNSWPSHFSSVATSRVCWKCEKPVDSSELFFCKCGVIMAPASCLDYFQLFNLENKFDLDDKYLSSKFKELQRLLHPDKFTQLSEIERQHSAEQSSLVNKAYRTLVKPLSRGLYMLELSGCPIDENTDNTDVEPDFLMDIMELNENLQSAESMDEVNLLEAANQAVLTDLLEDLSKAFGNGDTETARQILIHLKYYSNIDDKVKEIKRSKFDAS